MSHVIVEDNSNSQDFLRSSLSPHPGLQSPLISFRATPEPGNLCSSTGSPRWTPGKPFRAIDELRTVDVNVLGEHGRRNALSLNCFSAASKTAPRIPVPAAAPSAVVPPIVRSRVLGAILSQTPQSTVAQRKKACEAARFAQEAQRGLANLKDRMAGPCVEVAMDEIWQQVLENYNLYYESVKVPFLLFSDRPYTPIPVATCRVSAITGNFMVRRDVRIVMEKGMCRTKRFALPGFHALIGFKFNDLVAMYIRIVPSRHMMVLFMTKYDGPVIFFFCKQICLRVILVLMQTQFIEILHSLVPENDLAKYAIRILDYCEKLYVENMDRKTELAAPELICSEYATFFPDRPCQNDSRNWKDIREREPLDNWSQGDAANEGADSRSQNLASAKRPRLDIQDDESDENFVDFSMAGSEPIVDSVAITKKEREEAILNRLKARRAALDEKIAQQQVIKSVTLPNVLILLGKL